MAGILSSSEARSVGMSSLTLVVNVGITMGSNGLELHCVHRHSKLSCFVNIRYSVWEIPKMIGDIIITVKRPMCTP